ncbi:MAG: hypothetical protein M1832_004775 [Thelocarpon impressellum]|nr:MAG: hypothetical protein M1832_004775 [Thelocarpon impressellum]
MTNVDPEDPANDPADMEMSIFLDYLRSYNDMWDLFKKLDAEGLDWQEHLRARFPNPPPVQEPTLQAVRVAEVEAGIFAREKSLEEIYHSRHRHAAADPLNPGNHGSQVVQPGNHAPRPVEEGGSLELNEAEFTEVVAALTVVEFARDGQKQGREPRATITGPLKTWDITVDEAYARAVALAETYEFAAIEADPAFAAQLAQSQEENLITADESYAYKVFFAERLSYLTYDTAVEALERFGIESQTPVDEQIATRSVRFEDFDFASENHVDEHPGASITPPRSPDPNLAEQRRQIYEDWLDEFTQDLNDGYRLGTWYQKFIREGDESAGRRTLPASRLRDCISASDTVEEDDGDCESTAADGGSVLGDPFASPGSGEEQSDEEEAEEGDDDGERGEGEDEDEKDEDEKDEDEKDEDEKDEDDYGAIVVDEVDLCDLVSTTIFYGTALDFIVEEDETRPQAITDEEILHRHLISSLECIEEEDESGVDERAGGPEPVEGNRAREEADSGSPDARRVHMPDQYSNSSESTWDESDDSDDSDWDDGEDDSDDSDGEHEVLAHLDEDSPAPAPAAPQGGGGAGEGSADSDAVAVPINPLPVAGPANPPPSTLTVETTGPGDPLATFVIFPGSHPALAVSGPGDGPAGTGFGAGSLEWYDLPDMPTERPPATPIEKDRQARGKAVESLGATDKGKGREKTADEVFEEHERMESAHVILSSQELVTLHGMSREETNPQTRHRYEKVLLGHDQPAREKEGPRIKKESSGKRKSGGAKKEKASP